MMRYIRIAGILLWCLFYGKLHAAGKDIFELDNFFITTTMNSIDAEFSVKNTSATERKAFISLSLTDAAGKSFLQIPRQQFILAPGAIKKIRLTSAQLRPQLWSPEHPVLYAMRISAGYDNKEDVELKHLIPYLKSLAPVRDVRD
ncbi:MAG: hypothetical protein EOO88_42865, partial [Pedobacter sp.]